MLAGMGSLLRILTVGTLLVAAAEAQAPQPARRVAVVSVGIDDPAPSHQGFRAVAKAAVAFHRAVALAWDGRDAAALRRQLLELGPGRLPTDVLLVVPPERFDVMLHRSVLLALCTLDDDPFVDAAFGWVTARDGAAVQALWQRTEAVHGKGLRSHVWHSAAVASGMKSTRYAGNRSALERAAGFAGDSFYFGCVEKDPDVLAFVDRALPVLSQAAVLEFSGNGDPQGIWLFDGNRNRDRSKHWDYAPERVGSDPGGEMPRLMADRVRQLQLDGAVVWDGACHSAATCRVYVEGDIVSTFGKAPAGTVYELPPPQSFALAVLDAGAVALLAPVGPNHGLAVMRETETALRGGASLGEAVKASWDAVVMGAGGVPKLDLVVDGKLVKDGEQIMQGGGANRALLGDPTLRPFKATIDAREGVDVRPGEDGTFTVDVTWAEGFHATGWDMYGIDRHRGACLAVRVPLPGAATAFDVAVTAVGADGKALPYTFTRALVETFAGQRYLHLQANGARDAVEGKAVTLHFAVSPRR